MLERGKAAEHINKKVNNGIMSVSSWHVNSQKHNALKNHVMASTEKYNIAYL